MDWGAVGAAAAGLIVGAAAWLRERGRRKQAVEPWDGVIDRRHRPDRQTGHAVVALLEEAVVPMPRHWATYVDEVIVIKLSAVEGDVKATRAAVNDLSRIMQRLIGRLLPDEPVD